MTHESGKIDKLSDHDPKPALENENDEELEIELPRARDEIRAMQAPDAACRPLASAKGYLTATIKKSKTTTAIAAECAGPLPPTIESLDRIANALRLLHNDKVGNFEQVLEERLEKHPILSDTKFKDEYRKRLIEHATIHSIDTVKANRLQMIANLTKKQDVISRLLDPLSPKAHNQEEDNTSPLENTSILSPPQEPSPTLVSASSSETDQPPTLKTMTTVVDRNPPDSPKTIAHSEEPLSPEITQHDLKDFVAIDGSYINDSLYPHEKISQYPHEQAGTPKSNQPEDTFDQHAQRQAAEAESMRQEAIREEEALAKVTKDLDVAEKLYEESKALALERRKQQTQTTTLSNYAASKKEYLAYSERAHEAGMKRRAIMQRLEELNKATAEVESEITRHDQPDSPMTQNRYRQSTPLSQQPPPTVHEAPRNPTWRDRLTNTHGSGERSTENRSRQSNGGPYPAHYDVPPNFNPNQFPGYKDRSRQENNQDNMKEMMTMLTQAITEVVHTASRRNSPSSPETPSPRQSDQISKVMADFLPEFDGTQPELYEEFRTQFRAITETGNYSPAVRIAALQKALQGTARNAIAIFEDQGLSYEITWRTLDDMYGQARNPTRYEDQFKSLPFNKLDADVMNADLAKHFTFALKVLHHKAMTDGQLISALHQKLPYSISSQVAADIYLGKFDTFLEFHARVRAIVGGLQISKSKSFPSHKQPETFNVATALTDEESDSEEFMNTLYRHQQVRPPPNWRDKRNPRATITCLICSAPGHIALDCPYSYTQRVSAIHSARKCEKCLQSNSHEQGKCPRPYKCQTCRSTAHHTALCGVLGIMDNVKDGGIDLHNLTGYSQLFPAGFRQQQ